MKPTWKQKVAKSTAGNVSLNKKVMKMKQSWDEVDKILSSAGGKKKKK